MIVIHIGLAKSGSTTIQNFLSANEAALREASIDYPKIGRQKLVDHHNFASELRGAENFSPELGTLSELADHWRATPHDIMIISSEIFELSKPRAIEKLRRTLTIEKQSFRIVLVVRDPIQLLPSSYAQKVRYGRKTHDFDAFFDERMETARVDYFDTAKRWADVFGWENLRIRLLDSNFLVNGDLIDDFLTTAGVNPANPKIRALPRPGIVNESNGWRILEALRALYDGRHGLENNHPLLNWAAKSDRLDKRRKIERAAIEVGERWGWNKEKGVYLTRAQAARCREIYQQNILTLNEHLAEQLPTPPNLDAQVFVERKFLPDVARIRGQTLRAFYDNVGRSAPPEITANAQSTPAITESRVETVPAGHAGGLRVTANRKREKSLPPADGNVDSAHSEQRLKAFRDVRVARIGKSMGVFPKAPWPKIEGCLAVLFMARAGSTYLARELETVFEIGRMEESLNPPQVKDRPLAQIVAARRDPWFAFKAGLLGIVSGEFYGFFDAYLTKTSFIRLVRRDIVAQAISLVKAVQTEQWHAADAPAGVAAYDVAKIATAIKKLTAGVEQLRLYANRSGRPCQILVYEDFSRDDFSPALAACDALGVPRRDAEGTIVHRPVERVADATNDEWRARFAEDMDEKTRNLIERYGALIES